MLVNLTLQVKVWLNWIADTFFKDWGIYHFHLSGDFNENQAI